ncbi:MAG: FAD-dependent oxidoreductase [Planctomycetota bacterium]
MSVESAPQIAVLGGGPIGLETALYARYLGYKVDLFERSSRIAANLRRWGHVRLFSPFFMNATPLGVAAIAAQDSAWQRPEPDAQLLADEYVERYLAPLAATDLLTDSLHADAQVIGVSREGWLKREGVGDPRRKEAGFRLLATSAAGGEREHQADVVIDCTGVFGRHNEAGQGGAPALGERAAEPHIEYELPDLLGADRHRFAGRTTLVIGAGYSAATNVVALAQLAEQAPNTRIVWATRRMPSTPAAGPLRRIPNDRLPQRDALAATANSLVAAADPVEHRPGVVLKQIEFRGENDGFAVTLETPEGEELREVDRVIDNV